MNTEEAFIFLNKHQPMPPDSELDNDTIFLYNEARKLFLANPDPKCIPLFLNSFGERDGFGVYQLIEDVIKQFSYEEVIPHLVKALKSNLPSIRYWNAQIAANFPTDELKEILFELLYDKDEDVQYAALIALDQFSCNEIKDYIEDFISKEENQDLREFALQVINDHYD